MDVIQTIIGFLGLVAVFHIAYCLSVLSQNIQSIQVELQQVMQRIKRHSDAIKDAEIKLRALARPIANGQRDE